MLVLNDLQFDSRVKKEASSLIRGGHEVMVFATESTDAGIKIGRQELPFAGTKILVQHLKHPFWQVGHAVSRIKAGIRWLAAHVAPRVVTTVTDDRCEYSDGSQAVGLHVDKDPANNRWIDSRLFELKRLVRSILRSLAVFLPSYMVLNGWQRTVVQWNPDVAHCHDLETVGLGLDIKKALGCRIVYDSHELWLERAETKIPFVHPLVKRAEKLLESKILVQATATITVSPEIAEHLSSAYSAESQKFSVVRNKPILGFPPAPSKTGLPPEFVGAGSVAYSGQIGPHRALEDLLQAVSCSSSTNSRVTLLGYGEQRYIASLFELAGQVGVDLIHLPAVESEKVPATLSKCDVVFVGVGRVSTSYEYALPNKYFEALASGRPVVYPLLTSMARDALRFPSCFGYEPGALNSLENSLTNAMRFKVSRSEIRDRLEASDWASEEKTLVALYDQIAK